MLQVYQPLRFLVPLLTHPAYVVSDSTAPPALVMGNLTTVLEDLIRHLPRGLQSQAHNAVAAALRVLLYQGGDTEALTWLPAAEPAAATAADGAAPMETDGVAAADGAAAVDAQAAGDEGAAAAAMDASDSGAAASAAAAAAGAAAMDTAADAPAAAAADGAGGDAAMEATDSAVPSAAPADAAMQAADGAAAEAAADATPAVAAADADAAMAAADGDAAPAEAADEAAADEAADEAANVAARDAEFGIDASYSGAVQTQWLPGLGEHGVVLQWAPPGGDGGERGRAERLHNAVAALDMLLSVTAGSSAAAAVEPPAAAQVRGRHDRSPCARRNDGSCLVASAVSVCDCA